MINIVSFFTSLYAGFAVFSIIGFMANEAGIGVDKVIDSGEFTKLEWESGVSSNVTIVHISSIRPHMFNCLLLGHLFYLARKNIFKDTLGLYTHVSTFNRQLTAFGTKDTRKYKYF